MQREIDDLKRKLQAATGEGRANHPGVDLNSAPASATATASVQSTAPRRLGEVSISGAVVDELFKE